MPQKIRMWEVTAQDTLSEMTSSGINLEKRLEDWLDSDISMLDPDLMVIGRQVRTEFGGEIDLLCLDSTGALVAIELKKGQTPREVTAQALDYASWVKDLSYQQIEKLAEGYLAGALSEKFRENFDSEMPEALNESHRSVIVAESMDASTERIVRYLSELNVPINVATVQHFKAQDGREMLAQVFLIEPEQVPVTPTTRKPPPTLEQIREMAVQNGVGELYKKMAEQLDTTDAFTRKDTTSTGVSYKKTFSTGRAQVVFKLMPLWSNKEKGLLFELFTERLATVFELDNNDISALLPEEHWDWTPWPDAPEDKKSFWGGYQGFFKTDDEVKKFLGALNK